MKFKGRSIVITGAASGIGRATALHFLHEGAFVAAVDVDEAGLASLLTGDDASSARLLRCTGDISCAGDVDNFVTQAAEKFGRIDFLFNNAGVEFVAELVDTTDDQWDKVYDTNVRGTFLVSRACIPHMIKAGGGSIVNNASDAGLRGIRMNAAYSSSKAALIHLTRSMALDYGRYNVRSNCICPGCIRTPLCERFNAEVGSKQGRTGAEVLKEFVDANIPMGRVGEPEEVAAVVDFLCSDESRYVSGAVLPVDGGLTAGM